MRKLKRIEPVEAGYQIEGLLHALYSVELAFNRALAICSNFEDKAHFTDIHEHLELINCCWTVVDHCDRAREMVKLISRLNLLGKYGKEFVRSTEHARSVRNIYHHYQSKAIAETCRTTSVMGSLSWISRDDRGSCITAKLLSGATNDDVHSLIFDREENRFVGDYVFSVSGHDISISELAQISRTVLNTLELALEKMDAFECGEASSVVFRMSLNTVSLEEQ